MAPNVDEAVEQQELSFIADGNTKQYSHNEDSLVVSYKPKLALYHMIQQLFSLVLTQNSGKHVVVQSHSHAQLMATPWTVVHQASLSLTISEVCLSSCPLQW